MAEIETKEVLNNDSVITPFTSNEDFFDAVDNTGN